MDLVELRARIRAMSRDPEAFGRRAGLQPELVRQVLAGEIRPNAEIAAALRRALNPEPEPERGVVTGAVAIVAAVIYVTVLARMLRA